MPSSAHRRLTDRIRPWAAPEPPAGAPVVVVIGAGPAGLAIAALLRRHQVRAIVIDRRADVGGSWAGRYDSLRLNTVRWMSDLPGLRMPRQLGRWAGRDDIAAYLHDYAAHHRLEVELGDERSVERIERIERIERTPDSWLVQTKGGDMRADGVVVATGHARRMVVPQWAGVDTFRGRLVHSADYVGPDDHRGRRVVVVGAGSSGGEICAELARAGVDVTWAVRTAPRVFPREVLGVPATPFAPVADVFPDRVLDRVAPWLERLIYGRRDYLPEPVTPMMELFARCKEPLTADGIVGLIRAGRVRVVAGVSDLTETGVTLDDGIRLGADDVIAATGFRSGLEPIVGHLGVLDEHGRPTATIAHDTLGFVGFRIPFTGTLWAIEADARLVARRLSKVLGP